MESVKTAVPGEPHNGSMHHDITTDDSESTQAVAGDKIEPSSQSTLQHKIDMATLQLSQHSIYTVRNELRYINAKAYEPKYFAIGPYHSHKPTLRKREVHKLRYLNSLLARQSRNIGDCFLAIKSREKDARNCYAEDINLEPDKFLEMMVLDGCFIIEYVMRYINREKWEEDDLINKDWKRSCISGDLMLFENQIPLFIILELSNMFYGAEFESIVVRYLLHMFSDLYPFEVFRVPDNSTHAKHLLELIHMSIVLTYDGDPHVSKSDTGVNHSLMRQNTISSASTLSLCNVKFTKNSIGSMFHVSFQNGLMRLPRLVINDTTESFLRNMIAYEEYFQSEDNWHFTDFAILMDRLINTTDDVKLLVDCGIIEDSLGSQEAIAYMFHTLTENMLSNVNSFMYRSLFMKVREHCNRNVRKAKLNEWMTILRQTHLSNPWTIISVLAASLLIGLTIVQTIFTIIK